MKKSGECKGNLRSAQKIFRVMKMMCFLMFVLLVQVRGDVVAQNQVVSVDMKNCSVEEFLREIKEQTGIRFMYKSEYVEAIPRFDVHAKERQVLALLDEVFAGKGIKCLYDNGVIVLTKVQQQKGPEEVVIKGVVKDEREQPLPGVTVLIKGTTIGVATDSKGEFSLTTVKQDSLTLLFSFIGMKSREVKWTGQKMLHVVLQDDSHDMEEVVVTGYQTISRRESASAISTVKAKDIMVQGVGSIDQMLQGRIPGMMVLNTSGEPSATPKIRIRGNATINGNKSPVWVVDGVILEQDVPFTASDINSEDAEYLIGNAIAGLNPQDIETITVLKDASATAIYGVKAANGVIVITTKKGVVGRPVISYNGNLTLNTRPSYKDYHRMNSQERVLFSRQLIESNMNFGRVPTGETYEAAYEQLMSKQISQAEFEQKVETLQRRNTDWFDLLFRSDVTHTHALNVSGGTEAVKYYVSAGYSNIEGAARGSDSEKFSTLAKVDVEYNEYLGFTAKIDYATTSNTGYSSVVNPFDYAYSTTRTMPAYNEDGSYYMSYRAAGSTGRDYIGYNILKELKNTGKSSKMDDFNALLALRLKLWKGLKYEGTFSWHTGNTNTRDWATAQSYKVTEIRGYEYGAYTEYDPEFSDSRLPYGGMLTQGSTRKSGYTLRNMLSYSHLFGVHDVSVSAGTEARRNEYKGVSTTGYGWVPEFGEMFSPVETSSYISTYGGNKPTNTNSFTQVASFFGIASYCYDNRYVFNANIRSDGSNKFGSDPKYRWLPTYSFAVKWIASNESFLENAKWINNLSFRGSYGIQGNIHESATPYLIVTVGDRDGVTGLPISKISKLPNPDLRWEKTKSWNAAVDFALFDGRVKGGFDIYRKNTSDLIMSKQVAASTGQNVLYYNAGKMVNKGFEGFVNLGLVNNRDWDWRFGFNFGRNVNEITLANRDDLSEATVVDQMLAGTLAVEGQPIGSMYAYRFAGINQDNGYPLFYAKNGQKVHRALRQDLELVHCGSIFPKLSGGFDTQVTFKKVLSLSLNFAYSTGSVSRLPKFYDSSTIDPLTNLSDEWLKCWKQAGDNTIYPAPYNSTDMKNYLATETGSVYDISEGISGNSDPYNLYNDCDIRVAKADFLKLKMVALSYSVPQNVLDFLHISSMLVRFQVTNLFTIADKKWKGLDPETNGANIPALPTYSFGINVSF